MEITGLLPSFDRNLDQLRTVHQVLDQRPRLRHLDPVVVAEIVDGGNAHEPSSLYQERRLRLVARQPRCVQVCLGDDPVGHIVDSVEIGSVGRRHLTAGEQGFEGNLAV